MTATLLLLAALQGGLEVTASVDRARLPVGGELVLTVHARSRGSQPVELVFPPIVGLAVAGSREATEVALRAGSPVRTTTRELTLRAEQVGRVTIGAVIARRGATEVQTTPLVIAVDSARATAPVALEARARALVEAAAPPRGDEPSVAVMVSGDTALVGEQVDVVVVAWFPRVLRDRLRQPPVVSLPAAAGAWVLPQPAPAGIAFSRRSGSGWADAFVIHHILFPLAPGRVVIPPASVSYVLPLSFSFFSREERLTRTTDSVIIAVLPLPAQGDGAPPPGAVGERVTLDVRWSGHETRVGEPLDVTTTVAGVGNVALWAEPQIEWPTGLRAYPTGAEEHVGVEEGRVTGSRTFRTVVVPDSAGRFMLRDVRYAYYDVGTGRYGAAVAPPRTVVVSPAGEQRPARGRLPLAPSAEAALSDRIAGWLAPWAWGLVALLFPVAMYALRRRPHGARTPRSAPVAKPHRDPGRLARLEREFDALLTSQVPDERARYGGGLGNALRAAGIDPPVADHVLRLRDRLRAARYGPRAIGDGHELAAELEQVLTALGERSRRRRRGRSERRGRRRWLRRTATLLAGVGAAAAGGAGAQSLSAERLYEAGALRAAADSFAARASASSNVAAHWYNLGAALYGAGADGRAAAAWTMAARRAPRDPLVRRARELLPSPDLASGPLLATGPLTPHEWLLAGGAAWIACWLAFALGGRRSAAALGLAAALAAFGGAREWARARRPVAVVLNPATPVRAAPHGVAPPTTTLEAGAAVVVGRRHGRWLEVRRDDGVRGWVLDSAVVRL